MTCEVGPGGVGVPRPPWVPSWRCPSRGPGHKGGAYLSSDTNPRMSSVSQMISSKHTLLLG